MLVELNHQPNRGANCLDLGCGPAGVFVLLHDQQRITALDPLLDRYAVDLDVLSLADYPSVYFVAQAVENARLDTAPFDEIYCFNAVNHVADWELALDRITSWASPQTVLLLSSDVHRRKWLKWIFRLLPGDALHPQQHDREAYRSALLRRGWQIESEVLLRREWIFDYVGWRAVRRGA